MRTYLLAEDEGARYLLPRWLACLDPSLVKMEHVDHEVEHGYFLESTGGYPQLLRYVDGATATIADRPGWFHRLVVLVDAGEEEPAVVAETVRSRAGAGLPCALRVVVAVRCLECWALGNRRFVPSTVPPGPLRDWLEHFDVRTADPERLTPRVGWNTREQAAADYLRRVHVHRDVVWNKVRPEVVAQPKFLQQLELRRTETGHLQSLHAFLELFRAADVATPLQRAVGAT